MEKTFDKSQNLHVWRKQLINLKIYMYGENSLINLRIYMYGENRQSQTLKQ